MKTAEEILRTHINGCTCDEAYTKRNLTAPDCFWCNSSADIIDAMVEYSRQCKEQALQRIAVAISQLPENTEKACFEAAFEIVQQLEIPNDQQ